MDDRYRQSGFSRSDFKRLLIFTAPLVSVLVAFGLYVCFSLDTAALIIIFILLMFGIAKAYCLVAFRLPINPKSNLMANAISCIGYVIGLLFVDLFDWWFMPFLLAEMASLGYILLRTDTLRGPLQKTPLFFDASKTYAFLTLTNLVTYCSVYVDRIMLFPILGASAVSTYYTASFVGKACSFFTGPLSTVLLSYISDGSKKLTVKRYDVLNGMLVVVIVAVGFPLLLLAPFVTGLLYPSLVDQAMPYIYLANAASLLGVANGINMVIVLKAAPAQWQLIISMIKLLLYTSAIMVVSLTGSLLHFCLALLVANIVIFALTYFVGRIYVKRDSLKV